MLFADVNNKPIRKGSYLLDLKTLEIEQVLKTDKYSISTDKCKDSDNASYFSRFTVNIPKSKISVLNPYLELLKKTAEARIND